MRIRNWIDLNFFSSTRSMAYTLARRAFCAGYNTALEDTKSFVFDGRSIIATPEAREKADRLFNEFLESDEEGRVK